MDFDEYMDEHPAPKFGISVAWMVAWFAGILFLIYGVLAGMYFGLPIYPMHGIYRSMPLDGVRAGAKTQREFTIGWAGKWNARFYRLDDGNTYNGELKGWISVNDKVLRESLPLPDGNELNVPVKAKRGDRVTLCIKATPDMSGDGYCMFEVPKGTPSAGLITAGKLSSLFFIFAGVIVELFFVAYIVRRRQVLKVIDRVSNRYRAQDYDY